MLTVLSSRWGEIKIFEIEWMSSQITLAMQRHINKLISPPPSHVQKVLARWIKILWYDSIVDVNTLIINHDKVLYRTTTAIIYAHCGRRIPIVKNKIT